MGYDHIIGGLHITDIGTIPEHSTAEFDAVVSVCQDTVEDNVGCTYGHFPLADDPQSQQRWGGTYYYNEFRRAADAVYVSLCDSSVENVLVHCHRGRNRSAAVCAAALGRFLGRRYDHCIGIVQDARPIAAPNEIMESHARHYIETTTKGF